MKYLMDLNDLMIEQLRELYHGEIHLQELLKEFSKMANDQSLKKVFEGYSIQTRDQILVLKQVFNNIFEQKRGEKNVAIMAMTNEAKSLVRRGAGDEIKDALMILSLQRIIHFKIASYGAVCTYGKILGFWEEIDALHQDLESEKKIDRKLANLAEGIIDVKVPAHKL